MSFAHMLHMGEDVPPETLAVYFYHTSPRPYRQCVMCPAYFVVRPGVARDDRRYCSNACRARAYRHRLSEHTHG